LLAVIISYFTSEMVSYFTSEMVVTDRRLVNKSGLIKRRGYELNVNELNVNQVEGVQVKKGVVGLLLNYGDVTVTDTGGGEILFSRVKAPYTLKKWVQAAGKGVSVKLITASEYRAMGYVKDTLLSDEKILYVADIALWSHGLRIVLGILCAFLTVVGAIEEVKASGEMIHWVLYFWVLYFGFISAICLLPVIISYFTSEMVVTDRRLVNKSGLIKRRGYELNVNQVEGVQVKKGVVGILLNYGDVTVTVTGGGEILFSRVKAPYTLKKWVQATGKGVIDLNQDESKKIEPETKPKAHKNNTLDSRIIRCPTCKQKIRVKLPLQGKKGKCKACFSSFSIRIDDNGNLKVDKENTKQRAKSSDVFTISDCYGILDVGPTSTPDEVRTAYKKKIRQYHPDRVAGLGEKLKTMANEESKTINIAYSMLKSEGLAT